MPLFLPFAFLPWQALAATVVILFAMGCWICGASARMLKVADYGGIVFDEIVGYLLGSVQRRLCGGWGKFRIRGR